MKEKLKFVLAIQILALFVTVLADIFLPLLFPGESIDVTLDSYWKIQIIVFVLLMLAAFVIVPIMEFIERRL